MADLLEEEKRKRKEKEIADIKASKTVKQTSAIKSDQSASSASKMLSGINAAGGEDQGSTDSASSMAQGAAKGAAVGGPWGAVAGAALGLLKAEGAKKAARAKTRGKHAIEIGTLKKDLGREESDILGSLMANLRQTMLF